jgi:hypothetical protein
MREAAGAHAPTGSDTAGTSEQNCPVKQPVSPAVRGRTAARQDGYAPQVW